MPDVLPKATDAIPSIVSFIEKLVAAGNAYKAGGDVYFSVATDRGYGRLSRQKVANMEPEEDSPLKRAPQDFALWKATKPGEDTSWESPWGAGRPGWHIECSAMAEDAFGPVFEIHGGGLDLVFPHHENELAQSLALGHDFARLWMHNGLLTLDGEKMSKSLGNDMTIRGVVDTWGREVALMLLLSGQWRKPLDFNEGTLEQAAAQLETFRNVFRSPSEPVGDWPALEAALDDDFNTPEALAVLHGWRDHELLRRALAIFGLASLADTEEAPAEVAELAERRRKARDARDFAGADRLRDEIAAVGWEVRDVAEPPGYRLVPRS
jgi:cysteinyl-tRNA synthetase